MGRNCGYRCNECGTEDVPNNKPTRRSDKGAAIAGSYRDVSLLGPPASKAAWVKQIEVWKAEKANVSLSRGEDRARRRREKNMDWDTVAELLREFPNMSLEQAKLESTY